MITKHEQLAKLIDQLSKSCGITRQDDSTSVFLTRVLAMLMGTIAPVCYHQIYEWIVRFFTQNGTYLWINHILWHHFSWSAPTVVRGHLQNVRSKTENHKGFFVNRTTLSRFLSYKVSRRRSFLKFQDYAVLLASPNNCHGVSWVSTWLCLVVPVRTIRQMWIAWQSATCKGSEDGGEWNFLLVQVTWFALSA